VAKEAVSTSPRTNIFMLVLASALLLFAELALVRWTASMLPTLAYFKNLVLIAAFLGSGLGMAAASHRPRLAAWGPGLLAAVTLLVLAVRRWDLIGALALGDLAEFSFGVATVGDLLGSLRFLFWFVILFAASFAYFLTLGAVVGSELLPFAPLRGYVWNILGSLAGVLAFAGAAVATLPPGTWFALLAAGYAALRGDWRRRLARAAAVLACAAAVHVWSEPATWSPYSRISVQEENLGGDPPLVVHRLDIDGAYFMRAVDLRAPRLDISLIRSAKVHYDLPYLLTRPDRVLVLGAGMGNDVAAALRAGVRHVDAVEIDPAIIQAGRALHPERPYDSPRANVIVDDARSFLTRTGERYDLIVLGLLDSHTLLSQLPGVRLDNYVYTIESLRSMRRHLTERGVVALSFAVPVDRLWLAAKLDRLVQAAFGEAPIALAPMYDASFLFMAGPGVHRPELVHALDLPALAPFRVDRAALEREATRDGADRIAVPTDDWPHLYLRDRGLSAGHLLLFSFLLPLSLLTTRALARVSGRPDAHFALLGAAFLLVETKGISDLGILFGGTWWTVTAVIAAVLVMALISTLIVARTSCRRRWGYLGLFLALALLYLVPPGRLLALPLAAARVLGAALVAAPVLFSGLVFASSLRRAADSARALGWNLAGAVLGGFMEYASLAFGISSLALFAAALYGLSALALVTSGNASPRPAGAGG